MSATINIALVDDHNIIRAAFEEVFAKRSNYNVVLQAASGEEFLNAYSLLPSNAKPQVVLMDIRMPGEDGIKTTARIKASNPNIYVVMLTMMGTKEHILGAVRAGADGYVLKNATVEELLAAISIVSNGEKYYDTRITENIFQLLKDDKVQQDAADEMKNKWNSLTEKERQFIVLATSELTYTEIAAEMNVSVTTIEGWRQSVFTKFGVKTRVGLAMIAAKNDFLNK